MPETITSSRELPASERPADSASRSRSAQQLPWWGRYGVLITLVLLIVIFALTTHGFATLSNFKIVAGSNSVAAILALGALLPLMVGEFDLSVGANLEVASVLVAVLVGKDHWSFWLAAIITVMITGTIGVINGGLVAYLGVSSFIATLASGSVVSGLSLYLTNGQILFTGIPSGLRSFSQGNAGPIPNLLIVAVIATVVLWYLTERTPGGRYVISTGLNKEAAQLMGLRVRALVVSSFAASGLLAGIAGVLYLGRVGSASSGVGTSFLLPALAAGFLGATTIRVGRFNVFGTMIAVALVAVGLSGLELNGAPDWVAPVFDGGVLAAAIAASRIAVLRSER
ncbi:MAG TPA: ABC transporter permease [Solirubrobacteraceae bacterium]|nr:ABC transporter permease [Solirubrobacteraceae bacterium]